MEKYYVTVSYKGTTYMGKAAEMTDEKKINLENLLATVARGKVEHFQLEAANDNIIFFPEKLLKKAVISLIKL